MLQDEFLIFFATEEGQLILTRQKVSCNVGVVKGSASSPDERAF
jgi:hypothetical protein